ncbi:hypothetical protein GCM10011365_23590 [Marinicella pacifica]|uniref:Uncharacterized protein n=1 Tax=Marinicella pacifica TaxID=1171543 RepID=A0A917D029_9GAMM|nr:hypothetical protein [Marinicella pacifica]GGG01642.1 hypothetical protein GCM10011365_23590 [Marinicella pacifica]
MGITLRSIGLFGTALFALLFSVTFLSSDTIEQSAKGFVKYQIEKELKEKQALVTQSSLADSALKIAGRLGYEESKIKQDIENKLPDKIASVIASMCGYDCEKKKNLAQSITSGYLDRIKNIQLAQHTLADIIKDRYLKIIGELKFDLRIFLGSNLIMFLIVLIVSFAKPKAMAHLFLPSILLLAATAIAGAFYIFGQDWFYTILYNDYMGFAYLAYIGVIFMILLDIVFNKARVTTEVINAFLHTIGSAFSVVSC